MGAEAERDVQKNYWIEHSADLTVEAMMLDSRAADLDKEERPEVTYLYIIFLIKYIHISVNQFNSSGLDWWYHTVYWFEMFFFFFFVS